MLDSQTKSIDEAFYHAEMLEPQEQLRLILRLWANLPTDHWAAPTPEQLAEAHRRLREFDAGLRPDAPWEVVRHIVSKHPSSYLSPPTAKIYSAPRRFDLFTILVVTAAYSVLLSGMSALRFPPVATCYVAAFITLVGVGQAALFGGRKPRLASMLVGAAAYFAGTISFSYWNPRFDLVGMIPVLMFISAIFGSLLGYLAGVMVGGVFLVADAIRQRYGRPADQDSVAQPLADVGEELQRGDSHARTEPF